MYALLWLWTCTNGFDPSVLRLQRSPLHEGTGAVWFDTPNTQSGITPKTPCFCLNQIVNHLSSIYLFYLRKYFLSRSSSWRSHIAPGHVPRQQFTSSAVHGHSLSKTLQAVHGLLVAPHDHWQAIGIHWGGLNGSILPSKKVSIDATISRADWFCLRHRSF